MEEKWKSDSWSGEVEDKCIKQKKGGHPFNTRQNTTLDEGMELFPKYLIG